MSRLSFSLSFCFTNISFFKEQTVFYRFKTKENIFLDAVNNATLFSFRKIFLPILYRIFERKVLINRNTETVSNTCDTFVIMISFSFFKCFSHSDICFFAVTSQFWRLSFDHWTWNIKTFTKKDSLNFCVKFIFFNFLSELSFKSQFSSVILLL